MDLRNFDGEISREADCRRAAPPPRSRVRRFILVRHDVAAAAAAEQASELPPNESLVTTAQ